jgi:hypothetical protein
MACPCTHQTSRSSTKQKNRGTSLCSNPVGPVGSAGCRLNECSVNIREILDFKDLVGYWPLVKNCQTRGFVIPLTGIGAVFSETPIQSDTVGFKILTKQFLAPETEEALPAQFRVVSHDTIANAEPFYPWADSSDDTDNFMAYECP